MKLHVSILSDASSPATAPLSLWGGVAASHKEHRNWLVAGPTEHRTNTSRSVWSARLPLQQAVALLFLHLMLTTKYLLGCK